MSDICLFCGQPEKSCNPSKCVDFICGKCVQLLLAADQDELKRAYGKAVSLNYGDKASAIKTFLMEDEDAETEESERSMVRKRTMQAVRPARDRVRA